MTAALGSLIARWHRARLFLDIRDLFADAIQDVLPRWTYFLRPIFSMIERWTFGRANHINVVSSGFVPYLQERYADTPLSVVTNGIDDEFLVPASEAKASPEAGAYPQRTRVQVLYAGNVGDGQGLDRIVPDLARRLVDTHDFVVIGDGGARLRFLESTRGLPNVHWQAPVDRQQLHDLYQKADVLFLHLNDLPAFRKVLPSKLFEYAATGKPMLAGVAGYAADFLRTVPGVWVFTPCSLDAAAQCLTEITCFSFDRRNFIELHLRSRQMAQLARLTLRVGES
jgi:glycosyltransferase involved in cell wall biosynthesis